jgi:hypothetical protein
VGGQGQASLDARKVPANTALTLSPTAVTIERMFSVEATSAREALEGLNEEQRLAVTHDGGRCWCWRGQGTGKTTTLTSRVAWLVGQGVAPERTLLLTFTRRAAREMLGRAKTLLGPSLKGEPVGGTFHSVAHRLIRSHAGVLGLPPRFGVLDAADAADLLDLLREERGLARSSLDGSLDSTVPIAPGHHLSRPSRRFSRCHS